MATPKTRSPPSNPQLIQDKEVAILLEKIIDSVVVKVTTQGSALQPQQVKKTSDGALDIDSLPNEIIVEVFGYLKQNQLGQIARVCKRWNMLTKNPLLWRNVNVQLFQSHFSQTTVAKLFINGLPSCTTSIRLDFKKYENKVGRLDFMEHCVKLQEKCPHLKELILEYYEISGSLLAVIDLCTQYLQYVENLVFYHCEFSGSVARGENFGVSKIEILKLFFCAFNYFDKPPFSKMPCLKQLHLFGTNAEDTWFEDDTSFFNQLHVLNLGYTSITTRTFPAIQNHCHNLKELYLCSSSLRDHHLTFTDSAFPHLKTICLFDTWVTCEFVVSIIQFCPSLENVYVNGDVAESCAAHPFVVANRCKAGIVKAIDCFITIFTFK